MSYLGNGLELLWMYSLSPAPTNRRAQREIGIEILQSCALIGVHHLSHNGPTGRQNNIKDSIRKKATLNSVRYTV